MSLFIKGMKMPESCLKCPFTYEGDCTADEGLTDVYLLLTERHSKCPLKELPTPHGRLIDADDLYNKFKNEYCNRNCDSSVQGKRCDHCGVPRALNIILNAPTIIKAEASE